MLMNIASPQQLGLIEDHAMKTTLDETGRIALPEPVQAQLGVKAGDDVLLENHAGQWVIRAARDRSGLCWRGNVLVHEGVCEQPVDQVLDQIREDRIEHLSEGLAR
jgi:bifunctional DNA-binding transcriptional regulator/antitoxin component of YhaV-PrlF toxin-antitoxin module